MNPLRKSLSLRLLLILVAIALLIVFLIVQLFSKGLGSQWQNNIQPHLSQYLSYVHDDIGNPPDPERAKALSAQLPVNIYFYKDGSLEYSTNSQPLDVSSIKFRERSARRLHRLPDKSNKDGEQKGEPTKRQRLLPDNHAFGRDDRVSYLRANQGDYTIYYELRRRVGRSRYGDHFMWVLLGLGGVLLFGYFIIKRQLSPIQKIKHGVSEMSAGNLEHRIGVKGNDDLAQLGHSINTMAERIEHMLEAKRQLLLAISHELRSPLARSRIASEMLPASINKSRIQDDLAEMDKLIHEIMESERLQHHTELHFQQVDLVSLVHDVAQDSESINLIIADNELPVELDEARVRILIRNLVNNALQHGCKLPDDTITLNLQSTQTHALITVTDNGPGISAEHIDKLGEPFYRPDESRTRSTGGFGMGMTLVKRIVDAHGGKMTINSQTTSPSGTSVQIELPLSQTLPKSNRPV